jgi:uncharacterized protein YoxC
MTPVAVTLLVLCAVVVGAALVATLLSLRKTALRAERVLDMVEREIGPALGQIPPLIAELREVSQGTSEELAKMRAVVARAEDMSVKISKVVSALGTFTQVGQYASLAAGVKKGLDVFVRRLKAAP